MGQDNEYREWDNFTLFEDQEVAVTSILLRRKYSLNWCYTEAVFSNIHIYGFQIL